MSNVGRYRIVLSITLATFLVMAFGSYDTHSHGLLSDALHLLGDGIPFVLGWYVLKTEPPEDIEQNLETIITYFNVLFLAVAAVYIAAQGIHRLYYPVEVHQQVFGFALVGLIGNVAQLYFAWGLKHAHQQAGTFWSQILHLAMDVVSSIAVLASAYIVRATGNSKADTYASLLVAAVTAWAAWHCWREVGHDHHAHGHTH